MRTITIDRPTDTRAELPEAGSRSLLERAGGLRAQARHLDPVLAASFRRRACELELESWLLEIRGGRPYRPTDLDH